jgi:pimeloyl-ACP methyl ester carboxylesterase
MGLVQDRIGGSSYSYGARLSVLCHDVLPFESPAAISGQARLYPELGGLNAADFAASVCDAWQGGQADASFAEPVTSDVPTLILAGEWDPNTPPQWGLHVQRTLHNGYFIQLPGATHATASHSPDSCGWQLAAKFFDDPSTPPVADCLLTLREPVFK